MDVVCIGVVAVTLRERRPLKQAHTGLTKTIIKNVINYDLIVAKNSNRPIDLFKIVIIEYMIRSSAHRRALAVVVIIPIKPDSRRFEFTV